MKVHKNWSIPPAFPGETMVILGGGSSIIDLGHDKLIPKLEGKYPVITTNSALLLAPWAEVLFWADDRFYRESMWYLPRHLGWWKITRRPPPGKLPFPVHAVKAEHRGGLSESPSVIFGRNSGHMAINIALLMRVSRIILVGFDMQPKGKTHFHALHSRPANVDAFKTWIEDLDLAAPILRKAGVEVLNANPNSAIQAFLFCSIEDWV